VLNLLSKIIFICSIFCIAALAINLINKSHNKETDIRKIDPKSFPVCENPMDINSSEFKNLAMKNILKFAYDSLNFEKSEVENFRGRRLYYKFYKKDKENEMYLHNEIISRWQIYNKCNIYNNIPNTKCNFFALNKKLNTKYLFNLSNKVCNNGKMIGVKEAYASLDDKIMAKTLVYPWKFDKILTDDDCLVDNFFFDTHLLFAGKVKFNPYKYEDITLIEVEMEYDRDFILLYSNFVKDQTGINFTDFCKIVDKIRSENNIPEKRYAIVNSCADIQGYSIIHRDSPMKNNIIY